MNLEDIMDLKESSEKYNININTLKSICQNGSYGLKDGIDYRKTGRVWLITKNAIEKILKNKGDNKMGKFKINKTIKRNLAREVKDILKENKNEDFLEIIIMYNVNSGTFFIPDKGERIDKLEFEGNCFYKNLNFYKTDKPFKLILPEIENLIF